MDFAGRDRVAAASGSVDHLDWPYWLRSETARRRNLVLDLESINCPSWTVEFWVIERDHRDLVDERLREVTDAGLLVTYLLVDWTDPQILVYAWTLRPEARAALDRAIEGDSRARSTRE